MKTPQTTWTEFRAAFYNALDQVKPEKFLEAWKYGGHNMNPFYAETFMPKVAANIKLKLHPERYKRDYTFVNENDVPLILAEVETSHPTATREIINLCCFCAQLKVLVLSCDWEATEKSKFLDSWRKIIIDHHAAFQMDCLYAIVVGEWQNEHLIEYSFTLIDTGGNVIENDKHPVKL